MVKLKVSIDLVGTFKGLKMNYDDFFKNVVPKKSDKVEYFNADYNFIINDLRYYFSLQ